ncbi:LCP family protein [Streptomyces sp. SL13]|uniref:LCP family protein n=1 Tax=Streptantibioticus silvisoli TaxID=2705255 RepID=A0AA90K0F9_9ACTN|nr:LCP family protein [Streptantibioticus silvisoli]MDI5973001.1 LCP family protein [Streptantibioticus silvisoli]
MPQPARRTPRAVPAGRRRRPGARRRHRTHRARRIAGAVSLAVLTTSGLVNVAMEGVGGGIGRVDAFAGLDNRPPKSLGENFLLVGTDDRDHLTGAESARYRLGGAPCHCTDTVMLAHLSQDRSRLSVVSVPRDTEVRLPAGDGRPARITKLNSAYQQGGPRLAVATVEHLTGVHVDHYLEWDFAGFMKTVDALGGVPVCTEVPLRDAKSGLDLPAGTTVLNGGRALEYVRARYLDGTADLGRMRRQQKFLAEVVHRATSTGLLLDPVKLAGTVRTTLGSIRADTGLDPADLIHLAEAVRDFTPGSSEFTSVPVADLDRRLPGAGAAVTWDRPQADRLFAAIRADRPLTAGRSATGSHRAVPGTPVPVDPHAVRVVVTGADHDAVRRTAVTLLAEGFAVRPPSAVRRVPAVATSGGARTVISYDPRWDRSARSLAAALPGSTVRRVPLLGGVLRVALGTGRSPVAPVRYAPAAPEPGAGAGVAGAVTGDSELCP